MELTIQETEVLRALGRQYMEIASLPVQAEKRDLWKAINRSRMQRPMVLIDQQPWNELCADSFLKCVTSDPFWHTVEWNLRTVIYRWNHFPVDMVVEPFITIPKSITCTGYGIKNREDTLATDKTSDVLSHLYKNQFETDEDILKVKDMHFTHNEAESRLHMEQAAVIFDGIAPVRQSGGVQFHLGIWDRISETMGITDCYINMMDRPEYLLKLVERYTESTLCGIREANELGIHNDIISTCHCSHIYTDDLLPDFGAGRGPQSKNCWAFGLAQLFGSVSPELMAEFEFPFIKRMAKEFGHIYYGCCDRLDDRLDFVKEIPNVRKVSCSPWSHREEFAEKIGPELIMSNKPNPALIAGAVMDEDAVRADLRRTVDAAKRYHVNLEMILKDISTVQYHPERLTRWAEIAMEEVCR